MEAHGITQKDPVALIPCVSKYSEARLPAGGENVYLLLTLPACFRAGDAG
jgi:hypothetical protein